MANDPTPISGDDPDATRSSLIRRLHDWNDHAGWQDFFDTYWKLIYAVAIKAGLSDTEARDVVQETVVSVARSLQAGQYDRERGSFKSWLHAVTRNRIVDHFRRRQRSVPLADPGPGSTTGTQTIARIPDDSSLVLDAVWEEEWRKNLVDAATQRVRAKVPPDQFQIFDLSALKAIPADEVARLTRSSRAKVYLVKHRLTRMIRREVKMLETALADADGLGPSANQPPDSFPNTPKPAVRETHVMRLLTAFFGTILAINTAVLEPVWIDGQFDDWTPGNIVAVDPAGDTTGAFDITRLFLRSHRSVVFLRFDTGRLLNLQSGPLEEGTLVFRFTRKNDGAAVEINFRQRSVQFIAPSGEITQVGWYAAEYRSSPTFASPEFEGRLDLSVIGTAPGERLVRRAHSLRCFQRLKPLLTRSPRAARKTTCGALVSLNPQGASTNFWPAGR